MQKIWDGWSTLDPANTAQYYSKAPENVYYDITPLKYTGWAEYEVGVKKVLAGFKSAKFTIGDDARVMSDGRQGAIGTATWHGDVVMQDGSKSTMDGRWTVVWRNEGGRWLIIHEHVSVPMAEGGGESSKSPLAGGEYAAGPPGLDCRRHTLVTYTPGVNSERVSEVLPRHLAFVSQQLQEGTMLISGPYGDSLGGAPVGRGSRTDVETVVQKDPFVSEKVLVPEFHSWMHCVPVH